MGTGKEIIQRSKWTLYTFAWILRQGTLDVGQRVTASPDYPLCNRTFPLVAGLPSGPLTPFFRRYAPSTH
jgi:hypothetical protein